MFSQYIAQYRGQLCFPLPHCLMGKDQAPLQEHLGKIAQAQLVEHPLQHHETHDVGRVLQAVEAGTGPLVELPVAGPTSKAPIA